METSEQPRAARRSTGEWLFQLTTITLGVLIALSFDAALKWNADRTLVNAARANIALEIADNRRALDGHLAAFPERMARIENVLKLLGELDAGVEPTIREAELGMGVPSLGSAAWQTAERTGALALMEYVDVQRLADTYMLQALASDNLKEALGHRELRRQPVPRDGRSVHATPGRARRRACATARAARPVAARRAARPATARELRELRATLSGSTVPRSGSIALTLIDARP